MIAEPIDLDRRPADAWRIEPLLESPPVPAGPSRGGPLPPALARRYGSELRIALRTRRPTVVANFVTTLDGVVAFDTAGRTGGREVSGGFAPDRFVMGLLRATADAVLVGAGTVRSGRGHVWTPEHVYPSLAADFRAWREELGLAAPQPTTVIVSASGEIDPGHPALHRSDVPVLIATTADGARRLERLSLPVHVELAEIDATRGSVDLGGLRSVLVEHHLDVVLSEGGPTLFGQLVDAGLVDELFLTVAPQIAGRSAATPRLALVEGLGYEIGAAPWVTLSSAGRAGSHLFLRYALTDPAGRAG